jgi:hypothetical protein
MRQRRLPAMVEHEHEHEHDNELDGGAVDDHPQPARCSSTGKTTASGDAT